MASTLSCHMSHLPATELAKLAGISRRHLLRIIDLGETKEMIAEKTPGGHWRIQDTPELRLWAKDFSRWNGKSRRPDYDGKPLNEWHDSILDKSQKPSLSGLKSSRGESLEDVAADGIREASKNLAERIAKIRQETEAAMSKSYELGQLLSVMRRKKGSQFRVWLRKEMPDLCEADVNSLIYEAESVAEGRPPSPLSFVRRFIFSTRESDTEPAKRKQHRREDNPFAWVKIAGKLKATLTLKTIKAMDRHERETARFHLKPIVEHYKDLA